MNAKYPMSNSTNIKGMSECPSSNEGVFNLQDRTEMFALNLLMFLQKLPKSEINTMMSKQVLRSGTSVGANYMEADGAASKKDFRNKIAICRKEAKETKYWLKLLSQLDGVDVAVVKKLEDEARQLALIFSGIIRSCDKQK